MLSPKWKLYNVLMLGVGFLLLFTAFQTTANVETTTLGAFFSNKCNETRGTAPPLPYADKLGFISLCIIYFQVAVFTWLSPPITTLLGDKLSLVISGAMYCLLIGALIRPLVPTLFVASVLLGSGGGVLWTAQGKVLFDNSDETTIGRNSGIFWFMLQCSLVIGNLFYYVFLYLWKKDHGGSVDTVCIPFAANAAIYSVLTVLGVLGILSFLLLRSPGKDERKKEEEKRSLINESEIGDHLDPLPPQFETRGRKMKTACEKALHDFIGSFKLLITVKMSLLVVTFIYTGLELAFWSGTYATLVARSLQEADLPGLIGIMIGIGEIIGGGLFGIFGGLTRRVGRDPIVLMGMLVHMAAFLLIFYTLPDDSTYNLSPDINTATTIIKSHSSIYGVALLCALLLGFGDSCFNTQIYSILGEAYKGEWSAPAMAIFKFFQSIFSMAAFAYNGFVGLKWQLLILVIACALGTMTYALAEWIFKKQKQEISKQDTRDHKTE